MSKHYKKYGKRAQRKKSMNAFKTWLVRALTDLGIGTLLILIQRLLN